MGRPEEERERNRRNVQNINDWELPQINVKHQTRDTGSSENTKGKCPINKQINKNHKTPELCT